MKNSWLLNMFLTKIRKIAMQGTPTYLCFSICRFARRAYLKFSKKMKTKKLKSFGTMLFDIMTFAKQPIWERLLFSLVPFGCRNGSKKDCRCFCGSAKIVFTVRIKLLLNYWSFFLPTSARTLRILCSNTLKAPSFCWILTMGTPLWKVATGW